MRRAEVTAQVPRVTHHPQAARLLREAVSISANQGTARLNRLHVRVHRRYGSDYGF